MQNYILAEKYISYKKKLYSIIEDFDTFTDILGNPERNIIKKIPFQNDCIAVKSFKKPHFINKIAYKYFRKSKAERSFLHGEKLLKLGILNPEPIAYIENSDLIGITSSFYISYYTPYDFTIREVYDQPDAIQCVRAYARFSHFVHSKGVFIKDNTPGNTLVIRKDNKYEMYLVDLNRMQFHNELTFDQKMKSLSNNIKEQPYLDIFMNEYALASGYAIEEIKEKIFFYQGEFARKMKSKAKLKKRLRKLFPV
ncbi:Kdo domain containing protein [Apibacter raozihei]|uniref:Kdo domain containing protein n=1 Tax=Apibacter TaxID=1778601 RepID=UPI000FE40E2B|nr:MULTISPECIES: Kdo domain containing protein [Apibacter]